MVNNSNHNKNSRKKNKSKISRNRCNQLHESFIIFYKGLNQMSAAMYRLMMAFMIDEKIQPLKQSINSEEIRYRHRFAPLLQFDGTLQSYTNYKQCLDTFIRTKSTRLLYSESCQLFEQARKNFESLQNDSTFHDEVNIFMISEIFKVFKI